MTKLIGMEKDGITYIRIGYNINYLINGKSLEICPGNKDWAMIEGKIEKIEEIRKSYPIPIGFKLKDEYKSIVFGLIETLPVTAFDWDSEEQTYDGKNREFYNIIYSEPETSYNLIEFEVLDTNSKPENVPSYVIYDFPYDLKYHDAVKHNYPCHINYKDVFNLVYDRIIQYLTGKDKYTHDSFKNIQTLTVYETIKIPAGERNFVTYYPRMNSNKTKVKMIEIFDKKIPILKFIGEYKTNETDIIQAVRIEGKNYYDLMDNLEKYIQSILLIFDETKHEVCEHCKGTGIITKS